MGAMMVPPVNRAAIVWTYGPDRAKTCEHGVFWAVTRNSGHCFRTVID
jgi:hypothetical protein